MIHYVVGNRGNRKSKLLNNCEAQKDVKGDTEKSVYRFHQLKV